MFLADNLQDAFDCVGLLWEQAVDTPEDFSKIGDCVAVLMISELLSASTLPTLTNIMIYRDLASFATPKVVNESVLDYKLVWKRLQTPVVNPEARDVLFLLIYNWSEAASLLPSLWVLVLGEVEDYGVVWQRVAVFQLGITQLDIAKYTVWVWLRSNFVRYVWTTCYVGDSDVKLEKFFGFMTFKYKMDKKTCGIITFFKSFIQYIASYCTIWSLMMPGLLRSVVKILIKHAKLWFFIPWHTATSFLKIRTGIQPLSWNSIKIKPTTGLAYIHCPGVLKDISFLYFGQIAGLG
jgi:hypothetical protein